MFKTQIRVKEWNAGAMIHVWRDIRPSKGTAYTYDTRDAAYHALRFSNDGSLTRDDFRVIDIANNKEV